MKTSTGATFSWLLVLAWMASLTSGQDLVRIAQGECRAYSRRYRTVNCRIPNTTPDMTLQVEVVRNTGKQQCVEGKNFYVSQDNSVLTVKWPCSAVFLVSAVTGAAPATTPTTTTTTTTTTSTPFWLPWSEFGPCTASCGGGLQSRTRQCSTGVENDCANVFSYAVELSRCNTQDCIIEVTAPPTTLAPVTPSSGSCGISNPFRIVGGTQAGSCQFPWMVMVYDAVGGTVCGGSILDQTTVITAAHCLYRQDRFGRETLVAASDLEIYSGSSQMPFSVANVPGLRRNLASGLTVHEAYNSNTLANDIALVKLSQPITYDTCHQPVCLTDGSKTPQQTSGCRTMGWGVDSNRASASVQEDLFWAAVPVASDSECIDVYGSLGTGNTFCAGGDGRDACQGDSGGPLVCPETGSDGVSRYTMYGVVSAGIDGQCGTLYGLYTRVSSYLPWIQQNRS